jgi:hypothetical protein
MRIASDGNVGIGTSSPDKLLTLSGIGIGSTTSPAIRINNSRNTITVGDNYQEYYFLQCMQVVGE